MAEEVCGEGVRTYFEDAAYGPAPMHPSDNKCSSVEYGDSSDNVEIEELYSDPAALARGRVRED